MHHKVIALAIALLGVVACAPPVSHATVVVGGRDIATLTRSSDLVVVGVVVREGGTRNLVRDPYDLAREHQTLVGVAQDYEVSVEASLKGGAAGQILVTNARSMGKRGGEQVTNERFVPLVVGKRYMLFATRLPFEPSTYVLSFEPSQFELTGSAAVRSNWNEATTLFPVRPTGQFLNEVRTAAANP